MHEALLSSEEIAKAVDEGEFFRVPLDARSLQYELYYDEGSSKLPIAEDYTSFSTRQLNVEQTKELLLKLPEMRQLVEAQ